MRRRFFAENFWQNEHSLLKQSGRSLILKQNKPDKKRIMVFIRYCLLRKKAGYTQNLHHKLLSNEIIAQNAYK